jgi:hypothetical protein
MAQAPETWESRSIFGSFRAKPELVSTETKEALGAKGGWQKLRFLFANELLTPSSYGSTQHHNGRVQAPQNSVVVPSGSFLEAGYVWLLLMCHIPLNEEPLRQEAHSVQRTLLYSR